MPNAGGKREKREEKGEAWEGSAGEATDEEPRTAAEEPRATEAQLTCSKGDKGHLRTGTAAVGLTRTGVCIVPRR